MSTHLAERPSIRGRRTAEQVFAEEDRRAEWAVSWLRLSWIVTMVALGLVLPRLWVRDIQLVNAVFCVAAVGLVGIARQVSQRWWLRYAVISFDFAAVVFYLHLMFAAFTVVDNQSFLIASCCLLLLLVYGPRSSPRAAIYAATLAVLSVAYVIPAGQLTSAGSYFSLGIVAIAGAAGTFLSLRHRHAVELVVEREHFARFLPSEVVDAVIPGRTKVELGGEERTVTILFADIIGFTALSEGMTPTEVVEYVNVFLELATHVVFDHAGTLDKFVGDQVMAVFGAPLSRDDDAVRAARCALALRDATTKLNEERETRGLSAISVGVGVHTGRAVAGTVGCTERMEYTVIGDAVNVAARVESLTRNHGVDVLVSEATARSLQGRFELRSLGEMAVRGRAAPVGLLELVAERPPRPEETGA